MSTSVKGLAQDRLEDAIRKIAEQGKEKFEEDYHLFWPGCLTTPGGMMLADEWAVRWMLEAIASYQGVPKAIMAGKPVPEGYEEVITSTIRTRWDAHQQYWEFERVGANAKLYLVPTDKDTGKSKPRVLVQEFRPAIVRSSFFAHGTTIRFWCDLSLDGETGKAHCIIFLPCES